MHRRGYPGLFAPASLKQQWFVTPGGETAQLSGAFRSGLIEASGRSGSSRFPRRGLSGAFRSGLIEAVLVCTLFRSFFQGYPGLFAPASLKRHRFSPTIARASPLSGAFRSGLIEALFLCADGRCREKGYPGLFAPASLKRIGTTRCAGCATLLSGAFRSGLIEARHWWERADLTIVVIRGFSLRPH